MAKKPVVPSTQKHLEIAQIREDLVVMKDGSFRTVLVVSAVNFDLKSQQEQDAIIFQFQSFLNSLEFPIQIVVQSRQLELNSYIDTIVDAANAQTNELLRLQTLDYVDFVTRLISLANIMDKRFYVIVPYEQIAINQNFWSKLLGGRKTVPSYTETQYREAQTQLEERSNVITSGLAGLSLRVVRLNTEELIEFYYSIYNPEESPSQKLDDAENLVSGVVHRDQGQAGDI